jgi:polyhydroxyalkanoate synthesis regulator phasin
MTENNEQFASLKLMATLSGVEAHVRECISDWILITYDLPTTEEGNKARAKFLNDIRYIGGVMHSESCYLMPSSPESELAAIQLAEKTPSCYIWFSHIDEVKAKELTKEYDKAVKDDILKELKERIARMKKHAEDGKEAVVNRMRKKTERMLKDAAGIAARRGSEKLANEVSRLKSEYEGITVNTAGSWVSELKDLL